MKTLRKLILKLSFLLLFACPTVHSVHAQQVTITPAPIPDIGALPPAPEGAQLSFDKNAVRLLAYIVEISRLIGGGVTQLYGTSHAAEGLLTSIRDSVSGAKAIPVFNSPAEVAARNGGEGLKDMADTALTGGPVTPAGVQTALTEFRSTYHLNNAFALRDDVLLSQALIARTSAQGAIVASTAEDSYKRANASMIRINSFISALESSHDLKTSIDVNTRVMIEVAQQLNETLRTQAAIASMAGTYFMALGADAAEPDGFLGLMNFNR